MTLLFVLGGISHLFLGRLAPDSYTDFGNTALIPPLHDLWFSFVMPHIGALTLVLAFLEIAWGIGLLRQEMMKISAWCIILFLIFVTILGYSFPTTSWFEDFLVNRLSTIVLLILVLPLITSKADSPNILQLPTARGH